MDIETVIHLATAVDGTRELRAAWGPLALADSAAVESEAKAHAVDALGVVRDQLSPLGLTVDCAVVTGRAPQALAEEARRFAATLMVGGPGDDLGDPLAPAAQHLRTEVRRS